MGHPGQDQNIELVSRQYSWGGMENFIRKFVQGCAICQGSKVNTHPVKAPAMPIPHAGNTRPFSVITMDHITGLPMSNGFNAIQVVVDHDTTKGAVITPCTINVTALEAAELLFRDVYKRFGAPQRIISDRGPQFASGVFQELQRLVGVKTSQSTAYHPQTDRQTERVNQEIDLALRIYCLNDPDSWSDKLPAFEFCHNQRKH